MPLSSHQVLVLQDVIQLIEHRNAAIAANYHDPDDPRWQDEYIDNLHRIAQVKETIANGQKAKRGRR
jgi:hypothetical protein